MVNHAVTDTDGATCCVRWNAGLVTCERVRVP